MATELRDSLAAAFIGEYGTERASKLARGRVLLTVAANPGLMYFASTPKVDREDDGVPGATATVDSFADYVSGKLTERYDETLSRQSAHKLRSFARVVDALEGSPLPESFVNLVNEGGARAVPAALTPDEIVDGFTAIHGRDERPTATVIASQFRPASTTTDEDGDEDGDGFGDEGETTPDESPTSWADIVDAVDGFARSRRRGDVKAPTATQRKTLENALREALAI